MPILEVDQVEKILKVLLGGVREIFTVFSLGVEPLGPQGLETSFPFHPTFERLCSVLLAGEFGDLLEFWAQRKSSSFLQMSRRDTALCLLHVCNSEWPRAVCFWT